MLSEEYIGRVLEVKRVSDAGYRWSIDDCDQCVCSTSCVLD